MAASLAIKIVADTAGLIKAMQEGQAAIVAIGPSVENLQKKWAASSGKLVQDARTIVAAVSQVGTSTMTAGQAAGSLKTLEAAMAQISRTGQTIPPEMVATAEALRKVGGAVEGVTPHVHGMTAAISKADEFVLIFSGDATKGMMGLGAGIKETAQAMVDAVARMGGASKLTAADQAAVNKTVTEAIAKYQALGQAAPPAMIALAEATRQATKPVQTLGDRLAELGPKLQAAGTAMKSVGTTLTAAVTVPLMAMSTLSVKAAIDFESSFAGVRKTVDATEPEFQQLAQAFREMAKEIPINVNELNRIAEAGGQLGVKTADIMAFTRTMANMGIATNLSAEQAAMGLAQIANIINNEAGPQYDRLGSTIVDLGNKTAATESEIVEFGLRLAGAGKVAGLTEPEILGMGTALASVGINAEAGGTAFSKVMIEIAASVAKGGDAVKGFAEVAGMSSAAFSKAFEDDPAQAIIAFVVGLGQIDKAGGDLFGTLENLGITEQRMRDALLRSAGAGDLLSASIETGNAAWVANNALTVEAEKRYATTASQIQVLWNRVQDVAITFGTALLPMLKAVTQAMADWTPVLERVAKWFADLPVPVQASAIAIGLVFAAIGPVIFIGGQLLSSLGLIAAAFGTGGIAAGLFGTAAATATTGIGAAAAGTGLYATAMGVLGTAATATAGILLSWPALLVGIGAAILTVTDSWKEFKDLIGAVGSVISVFASNVLADLTAKIRADWTELQNLIGGWKSLEAVLGAATPEQIKASQAMEASRLATERSTFALGKLGTTVSTQSGFLKTTFAGWATALENVALSMERIVRPTVQGTNGFRTLATAGLLPAKQNAFELQAELDKLAKQGLEVVAAKSKAAETASLDHAKALQALQDRLTGAGVTQSLADLEAVFLRLTPAQLANKDITERLAEEVKKLGVPVTELSPALQAIVLPVQDITAGFAFLPGVIDPVIRNFNDIESAVIQAGPPLSVFGNVIGVTLPAEFVASKKTIDDWILSLEQVANIPPPDPGPWARFNGALMGNLAEVGAAFTQLAQIANTSLGAIFERIGTIISAMQLASTGSGQLQGGFKALGSGNVAEGLAGIASGVASVVAAMDAATSSTSRWANALGGLMTGAQAGSAFGGWGALIGGIGGLIVGLMRNTNDYAAAQARANAILAAEKEALEKAAAALQRVLKAAEDLASISAEDFAWLRVIAFNGTEGIEQLTAAIKTQLIGALNETVAAGRPFSQSMLDAIANAKALGLATEELAAIIATAQTNSITGLNALIQNIPIVGETGEAAANAIIVAFEAIMDSGADINALFSATGGSLADLQARMKAAGLEGTEAFARIEAMANNAGNAISNNAVVAAQGAVQVIVSLQQQARLTDVVFQSMTAQVYAAFLAMEQQGQGGQQALRRIAPELQTIWELQQDFNYVVDAGTQLLLDQAVAAGLVGNAHRSEAAKTTIALERIVTLLEILVTATGATLPTAIATGGEQAERAFANVGTAIETMASEGIVAGQQITGAMGNVSGAVTGLQGPLAAAGTSFEELEATAVGSMNNVATAVNNTIQMQSPTGLEGIVYYAGLAEEAIQTFAVNANNHLASVATSVSAVTVSFQHLTTSIPNVAGGTGGPSTPGGGTGGPSTPGYGIPIGPSVPGWHDNTGPVLYPFPPGFPFPVPPGGGRLPSFASGSDGFQNFGPGTLAMLHDWEAVVPLRASSGGVANSGSLGFAGGVPINGGRTVQDELAQLRAEMARDRRQLPRQLAVAIQDALVLGGMRR